MKKFLALLILLSSLFLSGCWDKIEIDERAFVGGIYVDVLEGGKSKSGDIKSFYEQDMNNRLKVIFTIANPKAIAGGGEEGFITVEAEADSIPDAIRKIGVRLNRTPFFAHAKVLVISKNILKDSKVFRELIDYAEREPDINAQVNVMMLDGSIDELVKIKPKLDIYLVTYIQGVFNNAQNLSYIVPIKLLQLTAQLNAGEKAYIPIITVKKDEIEIKGVALIKDNKLYKTVDEKYLRAFQYLNSQLKGGRKFINYNGTSVSYFIQDNYRDLYVKDDNGKLKFILKAELEGYIENNIFSKEQLEKKDLDKMEEILSESFKLELMETIKYFQEDVGADYLGLEDYTRKNYNKVYKKFKDNWDEAFKEAEFEVEAKAFIRRIGSKK
ncbi:MAG: Ger(x)C family spore germination protein [Clostridiales bacterium]|nr:Ger(x)C family spore germination protein [Clostridiales bacterium]